MPVISPFSPQCPRGKKKASNLGLIGVSAIIGDVAIIQMLEIEFYSTAVSRINPDDKWVVVLVRPLLVSCIAKTQAFFVITIL